MERLQQELTTGRPDYISTRLRAVLESCGTAYTWGWYGDRLCIRDCELPTKEAEQRLCVQHDRTDISGYCLGVDASTPRDGSGLRFYGNAQWTASA